MRRSRIGWVWVVSAWALALPACKNANCDQEVVARLQNDCQLVFGGPSAASCLGKSGAPNPDATGNAPEFDDYRQRACEVVDPPGERSCYLTSTCPAIAQGDCTPVEDKDNETVRQCILSTCLSAEQRGCGEGCGGKTTDWVSCRDCLLDCTQAQVDCEARCRDRG